jgi:hypothetical protein
MQTITDFLAGLGPWNWFIAAGLLFALETVVPGVHFLWFGCAAILVGVLALATGMTWQVQLLAFAIAAIAVLLLVRRYVRPESATSEHPDLNVRGAQYIGRTCTLEEPIVNGRGKVRIGDTVWLARGPDVPAGSLVTVTGVDGTALRVEQVRGA